VIFETPTARCSFRGDIVSQCFVCRRIRKNLFGGRPVALN
jgi:hypothetical protein